MLSLVLRKRANKAEGESPFWISFSDLMTALMTLFLVVMAVTLIAITKSIPETMAQEAARQKDIEIVMGLLKSESAPYEKVRVDAANYRIDLGEIVRFDSGSAAIAPEAAAFLRRYVPVLLKVKSSPQGQWVRRFVVEGFTDQDGDYATNLRLSLNRSLGVICALAPAATDGTALSREQLAQVQELFLVGGFSYNSIYKDKAASRRVELRVEFWGVGEAAKASVRDAETKELIRNKAFGACNGLIT